MLGQLHIRLSTNGNRPIVIVNENDRMPLALADVPIPENVNNFKSIRLSNFDESVRAFLKELQRNSLLTNVHLCFNRCPDVLLQIMTNFVPLFTNINSIRIDVDAHDSQVSEVLNLLQNEHSKLAIPMLTSTRVLYANYNGSDAWFCDWLHIPREDGKPRVLFLEGGPSSSHSDFIKHIKKDFLEANQAVSFYIQLGHFRDGYEKNVLPVSLTLENGQTQEKLVIKDGDEDEPCYYVTISRYPMGTNEKEFDEMTMTEDPDDDDYYRKIEFQP